MEHVNWEEYDRQHRDKNVALDDYVWCPNCEKVVEWHINEMATKVPALVGNGTTTWFAQDLLCKECCFVITTFHENQELANAKPASCAAPPQREKE